MSAKLKIEKETDDRIEVSFKDAPRQYINAIRRYSINNIPTYAIDAIVVYTNTTSLFDEYIAHRIGQVPITVEKNTDPEKVGFYLDIQGPAMIYSKDIKSNSKSAKVAVDNIPILKIKENQNLRLEGKVKLSIGREHAKFQAAVSGYTITEENEDKISGLLFIETLYQRKAKEVLSEVFDVIEKKLEELEGEINKNV